MSSDENTRLSRLWRHPAARPIGYLCAAVVLVVLLAVLGWAIPPRKAIVSTDRLGPQNGEAVAAYLERARNTLQGNDSEPHWALVSFTEGITADRIPEFTGGLRISEVNYHVAIDRVATPVTSIGVPAGDEVAVDSVKSAAAVVDSLVTYDDRTARVKQVVAARLRADCPCVVAVVVHGTLDRLRELAARNGVRAVEALPADASAGVFAVVPLLPEQTDTAGPLPDDGPIPEN